MSTLKWIWKYEDADMKADIKFVEMLICFSGSSNIYARLYVTLLLGPLSFSISNIVILFWPKSKY
jgi:hypothetical protein